MQCCINFRQTCLKMASMLQQTSSRCALCCCEISLHWLSWLDWLSWLHYLFVLAAVALAALAARSASAPAASASAQSAPALSPTALIVYLLPTHYPSHTLSLPYTILHTRYQDRFDPTCLQMSQMREQLHKFKSQMNNEVS